MIRPAGLSSSVSTRDRYASTAGNFGGKSGKNADQKAIEAANKTPW
jgi:hypothetical protein